MNFFFLKLMPPITPNFQSTVLNFFLEPVHIGSRFSTKKKAKSDEIMYFLELYIFMINGQVRPMRQNDPNSYSFDTYKMVHQSFDEPLAWTICQYCRKNFEKICD